MRTKIEMKATAVLVFAGVIILAIPLCCEGGKWDRENAAKGLSRYSDTSQQQPLSEKSLEVIETSRKWLEEVINKSRRTQSNIHDKIKKAFEEIKKVRSRTRRGLGPLTSCLADAVLSLSDKACDAITSKQTICHTVVSSLRVLKKIVGIADGNAVLQLICEHLGELAYDAGQFLHQLVCQWAKTAFGDSLPQFVVDYAC